MAESIFIKLDSIAGESVDAKHKGEIDVTSWSWGVHNTAGSGGSGGGAGKASFDALTFTHQIDAASPQLMLACATGKHLKDAALTMRGKGKSGHAFLVIKLRDVVVTSVALDADTEVRIEAVDLYFAKVEYLYTPQTPKGTAGTPVRFGFDVKKNKVI